LATGARIDWVLTLTVNVSKDPLHPDVTFIGWHDRYPAFEIIVMESNGDFKEIYRRAPVAGDHPGPNSLGDVNAVTVGGAGRIFN